MTFNPKATRPYAADTSDATKRLEEAIGVALDVIDSEVLHATVDGVEYLVVPALDVVKESVENLRRLAPFAHRVLEEDGSITVGSDFESHHDWLVSH